MYKGKKQYRKGSKKKNPKKSRSKLQVGIVFFFIGSVLGGMFIFVFYPVIFGVPEGFCPYCVGSGEFKLPPSNLGYTSWSKDRIIRENNGTIDDLKFYDEDIINLTITPHPTPVDININFQLSWLVKNLSDIEMITFVMTMKTNKTSDFVTRLSYANQSGGNYIILKDLHSNGETGWKEYRLNLYPNRTNLRNEYFICPYNMLFTIGLKLPATASTNDYNICFDSIYAQVQADNIDCEITKQLYDSDYF